MMNLMSKTASKVRKLGAKSSRQKCKFTLVIKRIVLEESVHGHIAVELSRGLKTAMTSPLPVKDGLVLTGSTQELSVISTLERTAENEQCEKIFKLTVKLVPMDASSRKINGDSKVLGTIEINIADFIASGDCTHAQLQARSWSLPCRKGGKLITVETMCRTRPVSTHKIASDESNDSLSDIGSHDGASDFEGVDLLKIKSEQVFTGSDLMISALKYQSDSDQSPTSKTSPLAKSYISPHMCQSNATNSGVSDSPLNPVSLTLAKMQAAKADIVAPNSADTGGKVAVRSAHIRPHLSANLSVVKEKLQSAGKVSQGGKVGRAGNVARGAWEAEEGLILSDIAPRRHDGEDSSMRDRHGASNVKRVVNTQGQYDHIARDEGTYSTNEAYDKTVDNAPCVSCAMLQATAKSVLDQDRQKLHKLELAEMQVHELNKHTAEATKEIVLIKERVWQTQTVREALEQECRHLKNKIGIADREMVQLENELKESDEKNCRLEQEVFALKKRVERLQLDHDKEREHAEELAENMSHERDSARERDRAAIRALQMSESDLRVEISRLRNELSASESARKECTDMYEVLRGHVHEFRESEAESTRRQALSAHELREALAQARAARNETTEMAAMCKQLREEMRQRNAEVVALRDERKKSEDERVRVDALLKEEIKKRSSLQEQLVAAEDAAAKEQRELKAKVQEIQCRLATEREISENRRRAQDQSELEDRTQLEDRNRALSESVAKLAAQHTADVAVIHQSEVLCGELRDKVAFMEVEHQRTIDNITQEWERRRQELESALQQAKSDAERNQELLEESYRRCNEQAVVEMENKQTQRTVMADASQLILEICDWQGALKTVVMGCEQEGQAFHAARERLCTLEDEILILVRERETISGNLSELQEALEGKDKELQALQTQASIQLEAARAEAEAQKKLSGEADLEYAAAKSDLRATLAHSKDTIGQLKELCARLETDLEGKQAALQAVREEMAAMRAAEVELRESFDRLRAENNFLAATKESFTMKAEEWTQEREEWEWLRAHWDSEAAQRLQESDILRQELEEMRQRERDQAWKHLVSQVDDAKGKMGDVSCAFCAIFNAQENMLSNGLSTEFALLDILQQRFPLLGQQERENQEARATKCLDEKKAEWLREKISGEGVIMEKVGRDQSLISTHREPPDPQHTNDCQVHAKEGKGKSDLGDPGAAPHTPQLELHFRVTELEHDLRQARAQAELEATVSAASQRQLVAMSAQLKQFQAEKQTAAPISGTDDSEIVAQLIQARVAHAEAEGIVLEVHKQNVALRQVVSKLKQKLTAMEVQMYQEVDVEHRDKVASDISNNTERPTQEGEGSSGGGRFGVRSALRKTLFGE